MLLILAKELIIALYETTVLSYNIQHENKNVNILHDKSFGEKLVYKLISKLQRIYVIDLCLSLILLFVYLINFAFPLRYTAISHDNNKIKGNSCSTMRI